MNIPKLQRQAEKLVSYGKINDAIEVYQEILSEDFQNSQVHQLVADLYIEKRDMQRASRHLFKLASDWLALGNAIEAASVYRKIIKILPKNTLAREKLLEILTKSGSRSEVLGLMVELCGVAESEGNAQKTIEYLERLTALDPGNKEHSTRLALFLSERGLKDKAVETLYQLTRAYFNEDRYDEAIRTLEKIRAVDPKDKNLPVRMAEAYEKQGKIEKAIEILLSTLAEDPAQAKTMTYLARLCIKAGKVDQAEQIYEKLIKSDRTYLAQTLPFVEVLLAERRFDRALAYLDRLHKEIKDPVARQKCIELLEEVLKLDPQKLEAYRLLEALYGAAFQYDQLAVTLLSHSDAYIAKCDYPKALEICRQLVELEPYNEEYRKKFQTIERMMSSATQQTPANRGRGNLPEEEDEETRHAAAKADSHFDKTVSIVTDEDVENFIVDIELLEKFGQHASAIGRLEHVVKLYPREIRLRQKLKSILFDKKMPKRAAQECLEIAKILQLQNQQEEANKYLREAQRLNPALSSARRDPSGDLPGSHASVATLTRGNYAALKGDLSEIGLLDVIQILDNCQKSGQVTISSDGQAGVIFLNSGRIVNAEFQEKKGEQAVYALVAVKGGNFEYQPSSTSFDVVINNSNTNLLLEGLRLLDEANRDADGSPEEVEPASEPTQHSAMPSAPPQPRRAAAPVLAPASHSHWVDENNPLDEL